MNTKTFVDIVFDAPPGAEGGRFVEVENPRGRSIALGTWVEQPNGYWALRITNAEWTRAVAEGTLTGDEVTE